MQKREQDKQTVTFRFDKKLLERIQEAAARDMRSANNLIEKVMQDYVNEKNIPM